MGVTVWSERVAHDALQVLIDTSYPGWFFNENVGLWNDIRNQGLRLIADALENDSGLGDNLAVRFLHDVESCTLPLPKLSIIWTDTMGIMPGLFGIIPIPDQVWELSLRYQPEQVLEGYAYLAQQPYCDLGLPSYISEHIRSAIKLHK